MDLKIEALPSKCRVKPSSPTPLHLRHYQLSFLDQISPPIYESFVIFYPNHCHTTGSDNLESSEKLKKSLSETLTYFYPLTGCIRDNTFVNCNDDGILFLEADVKGELSKLINYPKTNELRKLIQFELEDAEKLLLIVQFNRFECGGVAIGFAISHKVGDGLSALSFINSWAAITRGDPQLVIPPKLDSAALFPPKNASDVKPTAVKSTNFVTKRFVFRSAAVEAIRSNMLPNWKRKNQHPPSRIESLTAFIWSRFLSATKVESNPPKTYILLLAANLRPKTDPPLPYSSFGNYYCLVMANPSDETEETSSVVNQLRDSICRIDKEYIEKLQKEGRTEFLDFIWGDIERVARGEIVCLFFTSMCRFPLYDSDFGWGKPSWVAIPNLDLENFVVFTDTASGDGIEAQMNLKPEDMEKLEEDKELLSFVDLDA